ncbi:hypothetical protein IC608_16080 [Devosia sp. PTR5]|uniref:Uncharacterized protein n=1 Tax=Devosia oryzisoli TaxID=2774138 RepID=A0A927IRR4_9HYPH|nr:hypothetical protein [Devosia oryzisoli]MBD8066990.1 hypothetical protein [Devosia oryzisoli]
MNGHKRENVVDLWPSDRMYIDGQPYFYVGEMDSGYLFMPVNNEPCEVREVGIDELVHLLVQPGRFLLESEYLKRSRGR